MAHIQFLAFAEDLLHSFIDDLELVGPVGGVDVGPHVISIIVAAFGVKEEGGRQSV